MGSEEARGSQISGLLAADGGGRLGLASDAGQGLATARINALDIRGSGFEGFSV